MTIHYTYSGEKFMLEMIHNSEKKDVPEHQTRLYLGGLEFEHDKYGGNWSEFEPKAYYFGDGRYLYHEDRYQYYLTDHLGNTVVIFEDKDGDGEITQTTDPLTNEVIDRYFYYPFGLRWEMPEPYEIDYEDENHYRYNSKEWDRISEWYDYGWRWYDPVIGRWNAVDPLADHPNQVHISPYAYAWNIPILLIDPDGLCLDCGGNALKLAAYPYQVIGFHIGSGANKVWEQTKSSYSSIAGGVRTLLSRGDKYFSPGEAQQHTGDNVVLYGDGSPNGYQVPGSIANPDGETLHVEGLFDAMIGRTPSSTLKKGVLNPIMHVQGLSDNVNYLQDQYNRSQNSSSSGRSSSGGMLRVYLDLNTAVPDERVPSRGTTDTLHLNDGSMLERRRDEAGQLFTTPIN